MRKLFVLFLMTMMLSGAMVVKDLHALSFQVGEYNFVMEGFSYTDSVTSELRGLLRVASIQNEDTLAVIYQYGDDGDFLNVSFQDLFVASASDANTVGSVGYYSGGVAQLWNVADDSVYLANIAAGPTAPVFTGALIGDLLLDMDFADRVFDDVLPYTFQSLVISALPDLAIQTLGYLDIVGGDMIGTFDTNTFAEGTDVRLTGDAQLTGDTIDGWVVFRNQNVAAQTNAVPEPGTMLLLGAGLLGLAGYARKRRS